MKLLPEGVESEAAARRRIAQVLRDSKTGILAQCLILPVIGYPEFMALFYRLLVGSSQVPVVIKRSDDSTYDVPPALEILERAKTLPGLGLGDLLIILPYLAVFVRLRDELRATEILRNNHPLIQFVRHIGNASAHGNRWHFQSGEPRQTAAFRGLTLAASMHGSKALFDTLGPGDCLDLIDDVVEWLASQGQAAT